MLTAGDPIKNAQALLRNALPINNKPIREVQVGGSSAVGPGHWRAQRAASSMQARHACAQPPRLVPALTPRRARATQKELESISAALRIPGSKSLGPIARSVRSAQNIINKQRAKIEADFAPEKQVQR